MDNVENLTNSSSGQDMIPMEVHKNDFSMSGRIITVKFNKSYVSGVFTQDLTFSRLNSIQKRNASKMFQAIDLYLFS